MNDQRNLTKDVPTYPGWPKWTDRDDETLIEMVRPLVDETITDEDIKNIARSYMAHGPDGGGNHWGLLGKFIAMNIHDVAAARA